MEPALVPTSSRRSVRSARLGTDWAQSNPPIRGTVQRMWRLAGIIRLIPFRDPDTSPNRAVVCVLRPDLQPLQGFLAEPQLEPGTASGFCGVRYATNLTKEKPRICGALIGAPGFEPGTSPTRIMGEICGSWKKHLQIDAFRLGLNHSQNLGYSGRIPGFRQGNGFPAK